MEKGQSVGPNSYTQYGKATITGFTSSSGKYTRTLSVVDAGNPTLADGSVELGPSVNPDSWYNLLSWDWKHIVGTTWSTIWDNCVAGSVKDTGLAAAGTLITNLIARGGAVFLGPWGCAAIAIGGCIAYIVK